MAKQPFTPEDIPTDLAALKAEDLRTMVTRLGSAAKANLSVPASKAKKADLIAALEKTRPAPTGKAAKKASGKAGGPRSFTDAQADEVVRLRHDELLSWRQIADELGLGTPGVARRAYRRATGHEGVLPRIPGKPGRPTAAMLAGDEEPTFLGEVLAEALGSAALGVGRPASSMTSLSRWERASGSRSGRQFADAVAKTFSSGLLAREVECPLDEADGVSADAAEMTPPAPVPSWLRAAAVGGEVADAWILVCVMRDRAAEPVLGPALVAQPLNAELVNERDQSRHVVATLDVVEELAHHDAVRSRRASTSRWR